MRVLIVDQFGELGGAQQCLLDLLPAFLQAGWRTLLAAPQGPYLTRAGNAGSETAELEPSRYTAGRKSWGDKLRFAFDTPRLARRIRALGRGFGPDLLYINGPRPMPAAALARGATPVLFHSHNHVPQASAARVLRAALHSGKALAVACCRYAAEPYRESLRPDRLRIIYNGTAPVEGPCFSGGPLRIGVVGRVSPEKGQLDFVRAAKSVADQLPGARWQVIGDALFNDPSAQSYLEEVRATAEGSVELLGWRDDAATIIAELDILVVPSIREPATPRVIMEAFAGGTPVIAYPTGGIPEILHDGGGGRLLPDTDVSELGKAIVALARDTERRRGLGAAGREVWRERFQLDRYQSDMLTAMADAVESGRG